MVNQGPSPKRRRTDNGAVSADSIAQSNATSHLFTGQGNRQNRWMQGLTSETNGGGEGGVSGTVRGGGGAVQTSAGGSSSAGINGGAWSSHAASSVEATHLQPPSFTDIPDLGGLEGVDGAALLEALLSGRATSAKASWANVSRADSSSAAMAANGTTSEDAILVDYESPYARAASAATVPAAQNIRKSLDAQATTATRQGLPSPAPSDENSTSPIVAEAAQARRGPGRPRGSRNISSSRNTLASTPAVPRTISRTQDGTLQSQPPHSRQASLPSNTGNTAPASRGSPMLPQHMHAPSPLQRHQSSPFTAGPSPNVVPSNMLPAQQSPGSGAQYPPNAIVPPSPSIQQQFHQMAQMQQMQQQQRQQQPQQQPQQPLLNSFFDAQALLRGIANQLQAYERQDPSGKSIRGETGRLCLLREAVQKQDYFYIVLSQLSCLRSVSPRSLPTSMNGIGSDSYNYLDALLCANSALRAPLVQWFADFPRPIMQIYSAPQGQAAAYEAQVGAVIKFLQHLPKNWDALVNESRARQAPPLIQDVMERLWLFSPVLQTTAFRAIARTFWGNTPDVEAGIEALVSVHYVDQRTFHPLRKRSEVERQSAYKGYKTVLDAWRIHDRAVKLMLGEQVQRNVAMRARLLPPAFQVPVLAWAAFGVVVQSQQPTADQGQMPYNARVIAPRQQQPTPTAQAMPGQWPQPQPMRTASMDAAGMAALSSAGSPVAELQQQLQQQQNAFRTYQQLPHGHSATVPRSKRSVFPAEKDCPRAQPTHPDTTRAALHQAHLRSPVSGPADMAKGTQKLYRHVKACVLSPYRIEKDQATQTRYFSAGDKLLGIPRKTAHPEHPGQPVRLLKDGSATFRLRCCRYDPSVGFRDLSSWVTTDCFWPETLYFDINGTALEPRRKLQHGRYQPIDVTDYVTEGTNELRIIVNRSTRDSTPFDFAVAIEMVETISEERVLESVRTIDADTSLAAVKASLAGNSDDDDDDDIVAVSSTTTINLFDPISLASIFTTPVRGDKCLHRDPFDLDTFLSTRKREKPGYPSTADDWRCPICRGDVRPDELRLDAFLVQVREHLELLGQLDTRAIVVNANGSWEVKREERTGVRSASLEREEAEGTAKAKAKKPAPVVIELD